MKKMTARERAISAMKEIELHKRGFDYSGELRQAPQELQTFAYPCGIRFVFWSVVDYFSPDSFEKAWTLLSDAGRLKSEDKIKENLKKEYSEFLH
jgi:hypothetical protein